MSGRHAVGLKTLGAGLLVGTFLALGNVYMGLKTGWWDSGSITAAVLGFGLLSLPWGGRRQPGSVEETNLVQTIASAAGAGPATIGLLGAVPALALLGRHVSGGLLLLWGVSLGTLGILIGVSLRRRLIEEEKLPFPTGIATAEVVRAVHGGDRSASKRVVGAGLLAAVVSGVRDFTGWIPSVLAVPGTLAGAPAAAYGLGLAVSPMMLGAGVVAGPRVGLTLLGAALAAWVGIGPALVRTGVVPEPSYVALAGWLTWPGVGLMLGAATVSLAGQLGALGRAVVDLRSSGRGTGVGLPAAAVAAVLVGVLAVSGFGLAPWQAALALLATPLLATVCARAAGQTDISPVGDVGQLTQASVGFLGRGAPTGGLGAGAIVSGAAAQTGVSLWALRTGHALGASVRVQTLGLLLGGVAGVAVALPAYALLTAAHGLGTEALPAPGAVPWRALAVAGSGGLAGLPQGALQAAAAGLVVGLMLEALGRTRAARWVPSPGALGMGFIAPPAYSAAIALGGLAAWAWKAIRRAEVASEGQSVGAGAIAGEAITGVVSAAAIAAGLLGR